MDKVEPNKQDDNIEYRSISLPSVMVDEIERVVKESKGIFTSNADFVKEAIKEKLARQEQEA